MRELHARRTAALRPVSGTAHADKDYAVTIVRNFLYAALMLQYGARWRTSTDTQLAAIAAKSVKETRYHSSMRASGSCASATAPTNRTPRAGRARLPDAVHARILAADAIDDAIVAHRASARRRPRSRPRGARTWMTRSRKHTLTLPTPVKHV
ncbi:Phenylacetic acid catabolic protein [Burkholderia cenocepacia]|uniref:Phenylacetic acid catabolic protein n=1 Tax=Burkholderia cenocepacia TaxID=95486 RepID=UPI00207D3707|nr:Phenylacetic acid catabolic protein [Burkholderia cenocepacia]